MATSQKPAPAATSGAEMMKTVKAAWDKAPAGPKKDAALKQAQATERAPPTGRGSLSRSGGAGSVPERGHLRDRR
jgi:hypothetical protein